MIKNINDSNAVVTKGMLDDAIGGLAIMIEKGFAATAKREDLLALTKRVDNLTSRVDTLTLRVNCLEVKLNKSEKNMRARFDAALSELKEIRKELTVNNLKTKGDIANLDFRVSKLEKSIQP